MPFDDSSTPPATPPTDPPPRTARSLTTDADVAAHAEARVNDAAMPAESADRAPPSERTADGRVDVPPPAPSVPASAAPVVASPNEGGSSPSQHRPPTPFGWRVIEKIKEQGAGLAVALLTAVAAAALGVPHFDALGEWIVNRVQVRQARPADGTMFTVMVADLDGADGAVQAGQLFEVLGETRGISAYRRPEVLRVAGPGEYADQLAAAERTGQRWLAEKNADVLVWGRVAGSTLQLRFLPRAGRGSALGAYSAPTAVQLDTAFRAALGAQLVALTFAAAAPATKRQGQYVVTLLRPVAGKLERLLGNGSLLTGMQRASVQMSYGLALSIIGAQAGEARPLEQAVVAYREALREYTRERAPLDWARTQYNLGNALAELGERERGTARLEQAVVAYREALRERTRERAPLAWAATQDNLGTVLRALGERERDTARLEQAVAASREALREYTRERTPLDWAMAQSNLGNALQTLGERERGTAHLEQAVAAYHQAQGVFAADAAPEYLQGVIQNLRAAERLIAERQAGMRR